MIQCLPSVQLNQVVQGFQGSLSHPSLLQNLVVHGAPLCQENLYNANKIRCHWCLLFGSFLHTNFIYLLEYPNICYPSACSIQHIKKCPWTWRTCVSICFIIFIIEKTGSSTSKQNSACAHPSSHPTLSHTKRLIKDKKKVCRKPFRWAANQWG